MSNKDDTILPQAFITETHATGPDIANVAQKIEDAIAGESRTNAIVAMMSLVILLQAPHLVDNEMELQSVVWDLSKFLVLRLTGSDQPTTVGMVN